MERLIFYCTNYYILIMKVFTLFLRIILFLRGPNPNNPLIYGEIRPSGTIATDSIGIEDTFSRFNGHVEAGYPGAPV